MTSKILLEITSSNTEAALFMKLLEHHLHTSKNSTSMRKYNAVSVTEYYNA